MKEQFKSDSLIHCEMYLIGEELKYHSKKMGGNITQLMFTKSCSHTES